MGYGKFLRQLFEPLALYSTGGISEAELEAIGEEMDVHFESLEEIEKESIILTAQDKGLEQYEKILPYTPAYISAADRRRALLALARIDECSFTLAALNDTIAGCGIRAVAQELPQMRGIGISFPYNRGIPENIGELKDKIEKILPCHLNIEYIYLYTTWQETEDFFRSWSALQAAVPDWHTVEIYCGEE